ncbi:unnamed protein product [Lupinus luteus]|uniref:Uncharacterized protein n=1 Tax=Lupinus luteus TaxID=3873 RepID=A0AAV1XRY3_LUPLU
MDGTVSPDRRHRPFRLLAAWLSHPSFNETICKAWDPSFIGMQQCLAFNKSSLNGFWSSEMIKDLVPRNIAANIMGMHSPLND